MRKLYPWISGGFLGLAMALALNVYAQTPGGGGTTPVSHVPPATADHPHNDNIKDLYGTGNDVEQYYDGTDLIIDTAAVADSAVLLCTTASCPASPDNTGLHVFIGSAGATGNASSVFVAEGGSSGTVVGLQILGPNSASKNIYFGEPSSTSHGVIRVYGSTDTPADTMGFWIGASERVRLDADSFDFQQATTITTTAGDLVIAPTSTKVFIGSETAADQIEVSHDGTEGTIGTVAGTGGNVVFAPYAVDEIEISQNGLISALSNGPGILNQAGSTTVNIVNNHTDTDTGTKNGSGGDIWELEVGGADALFFEEESDAIDRMRMNIPQGSISATCVVGEWFLDTDATDELCHCTATDTWGCISLTTTSGPTD